MLSDPSEHMAAMKSGDGTANKDRWKGRRVAKKDANVVDAKVMRVEGGQF